MLFFRRYFSRWFFLMLAMLTTFEVAAQAHLIYGRVTDGTKPVELSNVAAYVLPDTSRPAAFVTTNDSGRFVLSIPRLPVLLKAQMVGYAPAVMRIENTSNDSIAVGDLILKMLNRDLTAVTVSGRKKMVVKTTNGLIVRADESITQAAGTVTDLLAATPTVLVDAEGGVSVRGKSPLLLINGRNSVLGASGLSKIPASSVDRIEITTMPSANNDAEAEGGIINIILKKNTARGTNGAVSASGGKGHAERFSSSILLNHNTKDWDFGFGYDNRFADRIRTITADRETYASTDERYLVQNRHDDRTEQSHNLRLSAERKLDVQSTLSIEGLYEYDKDRNYETLTSTVLDANKGFTSSNVRVSDEKQPEHNAELAATYTRDYKQKRKKMLASISQSYGYGNEQTSISTTPLDNQGKPMTNAYLQGTSNLEKTNITNLRFDYAWPVATHGVFESGYKGVLRWLNSDFKSGEEINGELVSNPKASNLFEFKEQIHAAYLQYRSTLDEPAKGKIVWDAGLRFEYTSNKGESQSGVTNFSNSYLNVFPTGSVTTYLSRDKWFRLSYARRINRPGLGTLNPFVDITDSLNPHSGNPYLQPELVHSADLGYNHAWDKGSAGINVYYRSGTNTILPYTTIDSNGVALSRPENFGSSITAGTEFIGNVAAGKAVNFTASFSVYHQQISGEKETVSIDSEQWTWYAKLIANLSLWKGSKWQWLFNYQGPTAIPQGRRLAQYNVDMGLVQTCLQGKARLGLTFTDIFDTRQSGTELSTADFHSNRISKADTRAVLLTFGYTFGSSFKEKVMKNQFNLE